VSMKTRPARDCRQGDPCLGSRICVRIGDDGPRFSCTPTRSRILYYWRRGRGFCATLSAASGKAGQLEARTRRWCGERARRQGPGVVTAIGATSTARSSPPMIRDRWSYLSERVQVPNIYDDLAVGDRVSFSVRAGRWRGGNAVRVQRSSAVNPARGGRMPRQLGRLQCRRLFSAAALSARNWLPWR